MRSEETGRSSLRQQKIYADNMEFTAEGYMDISDDGQTGETDYFNTMQKRI